MQMCFSVIHRLQGGKSHWAALVISMVMAFPATAQTTAGSVPTAPAPADPSTASPPADSGEVIPLGKVEVRGKRNLFDEQAARRKKLLDDSAPCLGCDAKPVEHHRKLLERVADYALDQVTPQAAPESNEADRLSSQIVNEAAHPTNSTP